MNPKIVCAAMLMDDGVIVAGVRHYSPEMRVVLRKMYGDKYKHSVVDQGFIDTMGKFLNRKDAWNVATVNNQIIRVVSTPGTLYSENLY